jgi:uncharacterized membrane protein
MSILILGLILFLGAHSVRVFAEGWRSAQIARGGEARWKGVIGVASLVGFGLIVWGFGLARNQPVMLWSPPVWTRHVAGLLMLLAFVLLVAAYVPGNALKARLGHPMVLAVKVWALAHLLANGNLGDVVLFGSFLVWAVLNFRAARRRPAEGPAVPVSGARTGLVVVIGVVAWAVFAFWAHGWLFGVKPFG